MGGGAVGVAVAIVVVLVVADGVTVAVVLWDVDGLLPVESSAAALLASVEFAWIAVAVSEGVASFVASTTILLSSS